MVAKCGIFSTTALRKGSYMYAVKYNVVLARKCRIFELGVASPLYPKEVAMNGQGYGRAV